MFSLVLPFHGDVSRLIGSLRILSSDISTYQIKEILLCHNGALLDDQNRRLIQPFESDRIKLLHTDAKGLGAGYKLGINNSQEPYIVLSASDLPFGFTDIVAFESLQVSEKAPRLSIGSKAHPNSKLPKYSLARRVFSFAYYLCRVVLLGWDSPKDSQGTIIIERDLAKELLPLCKADDYFFSTEICAFALERAVKIHELPIVIRPEAIEGSSSVNLISDSIALFRKLFELRSRIKGVKRSTR